MAGEAGGADGLTLVMPMAGRGSRFAAQGIHEPKPLIDLCGRPFFWWAAESVRRVVAPAQMLFVVLDEHRDTFAIDRRIRDYYPDARIVAIPDVTSGAAETALIGIEAVEGDGPIAVNDCDHAFIAPALAEAIPALAQAAGGLMCFRSADPAYSYARLDEAGRVVGTVEKQVVSDAAIAGCYLFRSAALFRDAYREYARDCPYNELFVSGLFNVLVDRGETVRKVDIDRHISFGTPAERAAVGEEQLNAFLPWRTGS